MGTRVISAILTLRDRDFSSNLSNASGQVDDLGRAVALVSNSVTRFSNNVGQSFRNIANSAKSVSFAALGAGVATLSASVATSVLEMEDSFAMLSAKTGMTGDELKKLEGVAKEVFVSGFGESITTVADDVALLQNMFKGLGDEELTSLTKNTATISKIMGAETKEVGRAIKGMTENFEGLSNSDAADLITTAFQKTGDYSDNLLDTFNEYSVHFSKMGLTAQEFTGILSNASGAFDIDKVGDAVKEFGLKAVDGSKGVADGFKAIGLDADEMGAKVAEGGESANNAFIATLSGLASITDEQERHNAGVALFGTQWEDVSGDVVLAMANGKDSIKDFSGATEKAGQTITNTFGSRVSQVWRDLKVSLADLANEKGATDLLNSLAKGAENLVPHIVSAVEGVVAFANGIKNNWGTIKEIVIGVTVAFAAFMVGMGAMSVIGTVTTFIKGMSGAITVATIAQQLFNKVLMANPIGLVIGALALLTAGVVLLYRNSETFRNGWNNAWNSIKNTTESSINGIIGGINNMIGVINKIPGVNVPIVPKVNWGEAKATMNVVSPTKVDKSYGMSNKATSSPTKNYGLVQGSYAVGSNNIPNDQIAQIHKGEMIIPARQAENLRKSGYNINNIDKNRAAVSGGTTKSNSFVININGSGASTEQILGDLVPKLKLALANI